MARRELRAQPQLKNLMEDSKTPTPWETTNYSSNCYCVLLVFFFRP